MSLSPATKEREMETEKQLMVYCLRLQTDEGRLRDYFAMFGDVSRAVLERDTATGKHRGFGSVVFSDHSILHTVVQYHHYIDARKVEVQRVLSGEQQHASARVKDGSNARNFVSDESMEKKKIFITGFQPIVSEEGFRRYFEEYGTVTDVLLMCDQREEQRERCGFGFVSFDSEDAVDKVLHKTFHHLNDMRVEAMRIRTKDTKTGGFDHAESGAQTGGGAESYEGDDALPRKLFGGGNISTKKIFQIFVGGLPCIVTDEVVRRYFGVYGSVIDVKLIREKRKPERNCGYGFVSFDSEQTAVKVLEKTLHEINGKRVEVKWIFPKDTNPDDLGLAVNRTGTGGNAGVCEGESSSSRNGKTKKIFVGGLLRTMTEESFRQYFEAYGAVSEAILMYDQRTQKRPRGFGFITFHSEDAVDSVLRKSFHELNGKQVEVKPAYPKDTNCSGGGFSTGSSGCDGSGSHDSPMTSDRCIRSHDTRVGFQPHRSSIYGAAGVYACGNRDVPTAGYRPVGYSDDTSLGCSSIYGASGYAYGNQDVPSAGYGSVGYGDGTSLGCLSICDASGYAYGNENVHGAGYEPVGYGDDTSLAWFLGNMRDIDDL